jgi:HTH-type transcriptional regulator / antitoxin HigA
MMELKPIRAETAYEAALEQVAPYFNNEPELRPAEADRFEVLVMLIEAYEAKHYRIALRTRSKRSSSVWNRPG